MLVWHLPTRSRVGNAVNDLVSGVVLFKLLLIDGLEVAGQAFCLNSVHDRGALLHTLWRMGVLKTEVFECLAVCRRELEVGRDIATQSRTGKRDKQRVSNVWMSERALRGLT